MDEPETIYTTILTAEYRDDQDMADIDVRYRTALPTRIPATLVAGRYPIGALATRLEGEDGELVVATYPTRYDLVIDEALKEYAAETDDRIHWMTWLEDEGFAEFVHVLQNAVDEKGEAYLVASSDKLPEATIFDEAQRYLHDRRQQHERANRNRWRSY